MRIKNKIVIGLLSGFLFLINFAFAQQLPISEGQVYVCPLATKLEEINPRCDCRIDLVLGETVTSTCPKNNNTYEMTLTITEYEGEQYYAIYGFENGGAGVNFPPKAKISGKLEGTVGEELTFSAKESFDPNGDPLEFYWDFGEKNLVRGESFSHIFTNPGNYILKLIVEDGMASSSATATITIYSKPLSGGFSAYFPENIPREKMATENLKEEIFTKETKFLASSTPKIALQIPSQKESPTKELPKAVESKETLQEKEFQEKSLPREIFLASLLDSMKEKFFVYIASSIFLIFGIFKIIRYFFPRKKV